MPPQILLFNVLVGTNVSLFSENIFFTNLFMLHVRIPSLMIPSNAKFPASCGHAKSIPLLDPVLYIDAIVRDYGSIYLQTIVHNE
jgi:hypothetical protein